MARGRRTTHTLAEQLDDVSIRINNLKSSLKELEQEKINLEERIKLDRLSELDVFISEYGLSIDSLKEMINSNIEKEVVA